MDVSLLSQYLLPNLDDSSSDEETEVTELCTELEPTIHDNCKEMQSINSEAESLVDTKEFLEFVDTMDVDDTSKVDESDTQEESVHDVTRQDEIDPKSESQFSSFMSYHEGESSSLDPGTNGKELCKSPIEDSTKRHDSGVVDQRDINSHDSDLIAYESNDTSVPSIDISDHSNIHSQSQNVTDDASVNPIVDVEVEPVRRSARERKQTRFFGNPWLYRGRGGRGGYRGRGGRGRGGLILCYWCRDFLPKEQANHKVAQCPYQKQAKDDWWKNQLSTVQGNAQVTQPNTEEN